MVSGAVVVVVVVVELLELELDPEPLDVELGEPQAVSKKTVKTIGAIARWKGLIFMFFGEYLHIVTVSIVARVMSNHSKN